MAMSFVAEAKARSEERGEPGERTALNRQERQHEQEGLRTPAERRSSSAAWWPPCRRKGPKELRIPRGACKSEVRPIRPNPARSLLEQHLRQVVHDRVRIPFREVRGRHPDAAVTPLAGSDGHWTALARREGINGRRGAANHRDDPIPYHESSAIDSSPSKAS